MPVQNIYAKIQQKSKAGQGLDLNNERYKLAQTFESELKQAKPGNGPAAPLTLIIVNCFD